VLLGKGSLGIKSATMRTFWYYLCTINEPLRIKAPSTKEN
jgi:hypothetical protein